MRTREKQAADASGGDPTVIAAASQRARAEGAVTQVEALVDRNPTLGRQVLENNRGILPPDTYDKLVTRLRPQLAGDNFDEAVRRVQAGQPLSDGTVLHTPPADGGPTISDGAALAAEKRLSAGIGTDADRALHAAYLRQQNTPAGQQAPAG